MRIFLITSVIIMLLSTSAYTSSLVGNLDKSRKDFYLCVDALPVKARSAFRGGTSRERMAGLSPRTRKAIEECFEKMREMEDAEAANSIKEALAGFFKGTRDLGNPVMLREAEEIAERLIKTTQELNRVYRMGRAALWHNFLIKVGMKKGGYCYQWVTGLLKALPQEKYNYFERHWGVHRMGKITENNAVIITARGRPISSGIVYDPWRGKGRPFWRYVGGDNQDWSERLTEDEIISAASDPFQIYVENAPSKSLDTR